MASESFSNLYETASNYSQTPLYNFVWKFLDDQPSVRDDSIDAANTSSICDRCLNKINDYDLATVRAAEMEKELRDMLAQTEAFYAVQQNTTVPCGSDNDLVSQAGSEICVMIDPNSLLPIEASSSPNTSHPTGNDNDRYVIELSDEEAI